VPFFT
jgi:hypothetical protein